MKQKTKKIGVGIVGGIVLLAGIVMIPYPGPGWLVVFAGLGILSTEFEWAKRTLHYAKGKYDAWQLWLKSQSPVLRAVFWILTALVVVVTIWLLNGYGILNQLLGLGWDWVQSPFIR
ncbi:TIGR02611 family protein [Candidatus Saccharibacteria bacterium]|nr:TIGR02611 family protein [Candidatus Saccharibacteria bacterium]